MISDFKSLFERDLLRLEKEIEQYSSDQDLWIKSNDHPNSGGNLCLHICGNLQHFIGHALGETDYQRDREAEFGNSGLTKSELIRLTTQTREVVSKSLSQLDNSILNKSYPLLIKDKEVNSSYFLLHLYGHLNYHLGQINYHRRGIS